MNTLRTTASASTEPPSPAVASTREADASAGDAASRAALLRVLEDLLPRRPRERCPAGWFKDPIRRAGPCLGQRHTVGCCAREAKPLAAVAPDVRLNPTGWAGRRSAGAPRSLSRAPLKSWPPPTLFLLDPPFGVGARVGGLRGAGRHLHRRSISATSTATRRARSSQRFPRRSSPSSRPADAMPARVRRLLRGPGLYSPRWHHGHGHVLCHLRLTPGVWVWVRACARCAAQQRLTLTRSVMVRVLPLRGLTRAVASTAAAGSFTEGSAAHVRVRHLGDKLK